MELPALTDLVFTNGKHVSDEIRWSLLEWLLGFPREFVKRLHNDNVSTQLLAVIFTIKYMIQVLFSFEGTSIGILEFFRPI